MRIVKSHVKELKKKPDRDFLFSNPVLFFVCILAIVAYENIDIFQVYNRHR